MKTHRGRPTTRRRGRRVAIVHQGFIPPYRVAFFEQLSAASAVEYVVFHGEPLASTGHRAAPGPFAFPEHRVRNRALRVLGRELLVQPVVAPIVRGFDAAVLGAELKLVANPAVGALLAATRRPVILWGQGFEKEEDAGGALRSAGTWLKARGARLASGYLVYTDRGAQRLIASGVDPERVTVVRNTLDMAAHERWERELRDADEPTLRQTLGLSETSVVLAFIGRVYREKRVDELVSLARELQRHSLPVEVVVIGDGPDLERVRGLAEGEANLRFAGAIYDEEGVARWLRVASAVVIPGKVGLAVNHALAHGVPVLTRASGLHAPEVEYLRDGVNGLIVEGSGVAFADAVADFVRSRDTRERLAAGALASRDDLRLDAMVAAFDGGVRRVLAVS